MTEREAFESWFSQEFRCDEWVYNPFSRMEFNDIDAYSCSTVNAAWLAWQAAKAQAVSQEKGRSDFEIISQTIELVDLLASANRFQRDKSRPFPFDSNNPRNIEWWRLACKIQELLTNTDPNNCDFDEYKAMIEAAQE